MPESPKTRAKRERSARSRKSYEKHKSKILQTYEEHKSNGLCTARGCNNPVALSKTRCQKHLDALKKFTTKYRNKLKQKILDHYGQKCACTTCPGGCNVTNQKHLTVDHKNNDGAKHRRQLSKNGKRSPGGSGFYSWIIKNNFPDDLQVLCWNCNCAKENFGGCS